MRLNPPTFIVFILSLACVVVAVIGKLGYVAVPELVPNQEFWMAIFGYAVLMVGNLVRGL